MAATCLLASSSLGSALEAQVITDISPNRQRVHELITLRGSGFGTFVPGVSSVTFSGSGVTIEAGLPYVWRDDFIQIRVPVGDRVAAVATPIPKGPLAVAVQIGAATSNTAAFQVLTVTPQTPVWEEMTLIVSDVDVSPFLGSPNFNLARTKDAEVGDVNGDGLPDLIDNNSSNISNGTHAVVRTNLGGNLFTTRRLEPLDDADLGDFATTVPAAGDYVGNSVAYDADLVDLDNDGLPDIVHAAANDKSRVRVLMNNHLGVPGRFLESTSTWVQGPSLAGSPDDVSHTDVNHDGFVDVAVSVRFTPTAQVYLNQNGASFAPGIQVTNTAGSMHDAFFIDANDDGFPDLVLVDENVGSSRLFLNDGNPTPAFTPTEVLSLSTGALAGLAADFNADGLDDAAISGTGGAVFLNDPASPGTFSSQPLPAAGTGGHYDIEAGDIDLDGDIDLIGAAIPFGSLEDNLRVWLNDGTGSFTNAADPISGLFPGLEDYERMSADLIDYDLDGDLDLYLTGADGQSVGPGFGDVPNQFWASRIAEIFADGFESGDFFPWTGLAVSTIP